MLVGDNLSKKLSHTMRSGRELVSIWLTESDLCYFMINCNYYKINCNYYMNFFLGVDVCMIEDAWIKLKI